jgi:Protein of Unknown function (DUF2784)
MLVHRILANVVLIVHSTYVLTVVLGLVAIVAGLALGKRWARNFWLRIGHLAMIGIVVVQSWLGIVCPLTRLENDLRRKGNEALYSRDFIEYWLHRVMYYSFPPWVFVAAYTTFGIAVLATFLFGPPDRPWRRRAGSGTGK